VRLFVLQGGYGVTDPLTANGHLVDELGEYRVATDLVERSEASRVQDRDQVAEEALSECSRRMRIECATHASYIHEVVIWEMVADAAQKFCWEIEDPK
jgi:hypothetical protein